MDEGKEQTVDEALRLHDKCLKNEQKWVTKKGDDDDDDDEDGDKWSISSSFDNSITNNASPSSSSSSEEEQSDVVNDVSSPISISPSSSSSSSDVFELSELVAHLPIRRGLSNFYHGKSESFTCVTRVATIEELQKKETRCRRKTTKAANGLDFYKSYTLPKAIISKKVPSRSCSCNFPGRRGSFFSRRPL